MYHVCIYIETYRAVGQPVWHAINSLVLCRPLSLVSYVHKFWSSVFGSTYNVKSPKAWRLVSSTLGIIPARFYCAYEKERRLSLSTGSGSDSQQVKLDREA